ncbi:tripartite tricarboxylate transporter [Marinomonas sp. M1K-6]|uniref:Tripartite tricarboxylate transporter n=1 Tax=Marinomonas profundi TaxID=2726122 RepID=A0A847R112_9GAMM|nr:tripartite tricarboxylate transporter TctB family protein [Marinomonas profundi]NLQ17351.1 tripartite tricarboxylate transporter [Marinomonas profundi]UDV01879.1 tripartite tricarboxylate transporter TctB family protein [Marinomonas profundi]
MFDWFISLNSVSIDFDLSHQFFPRIIITLLVVLGGVIVLANFRSVMQAIRSGRYQFFVRNADFFRLLVTLVLIPAYFWSMDAIGGVLPNMGLGFLLASIPFVFLMSILYCHERTRRNVTIIVINAVVAPTFVWGVLYHLFLVSMP